MVISNGIYKNLADHDAPDKTKRMKPVFERFEAVVNSSEFYIITFEGKIFNQGFKLIRFMRWLIFELFLWT